MSYVASSAKADAVVAELQAKGVRAAAFKADQADAAQVEGLVKAVAEHFGKPDILVNNAGVSAMGAIDNPANDLAAFEHMYAVNLFAVVVAIRAASRLMGEGGRIITVGSVLAWRTMPGTADYSVTKAAIVGYSRAAARDLGPRKITVNVIQSGSAPAPT